MENILRNLEQNNYFKGITHIGQIAGIEMFKIRTNFDESKFQNMPTTLLLHGTSEIKSILENGLHTEAAAVYGVEENGAVYGEGLYFTQDISIAMNYTNIAAFIIFEIRLNVLELTNDRDEFVVNVTDISDVVVPRFLLWDRNNIAKSIDDDMFYLAVYNFVYDVKQKSRVSGESHHGNVTNINNVPLDSFQSHYRRQDETGFDDDYDEILTQHIVEMLLDQ